MTSVVIWSYIENKINLTFKTSRGCREEGVPWGWGAMGNTGILFLSIAPFLMPRMAFLKSGKGQLVAPHAPLLFVLQNLASALSEHGEHLFKASKTVNWANHVDICGGVRRARILQCCQSTAAKDPTPESLHTFLSSSPAARRYCCSSYVATKRQSPCTIFVYTVAMLIPYST